MKFTWDALCVLEAAERANAKARLGKKFDPVLFQAVAEFELNRLRNETSNQRRVK